MLVRAWKKSVAYYICGIDKLVRLRQGVGINAHRIAAQCRLASDKELCKHRISTTKRAF